MANMTPMMRQYLEMKDKYPGMILFFRLGDFYEMFFDDAKLVSRELELTLTGKSCGMEERDDAACRCAGRRALPACPRARGAAGAF